MSLNNTPLTWNNKTEFVPSKPKEKTMSTYDYLSNAETEIRNALKSAVDVDGVNQIKQVVDTLYAVNKLKSKYQFKVDESKNMLSEYDNINFDTNSPDVITFGDDSNDDLILG
tara:strand:+ start:226 stop:564 length:339 start_codon:yes stop_codon:yes gene_type:complete